MKGTYCLIIELKKSIKTKIGALGKIEFMPGYYVYVGSAMNSIESRVKRHLADDKKLHWHIDYLLKNKDADIVEVIYTLSSRKIECELSDYIKNISDDSIDSFGSSDCSCDSHLHYFQNYDKALKVVIDSYEDLNMKHYNLNDFKKLIK
ncbi:GIY-YIG nuclease family protein [Methanobrevibacter boviskoreani]|uniref:GIY-YIG nuclease family protein n=1 Tax=Methanobrevibacter boviskoreani TaxID=1348249 RepID=UPI0023A7F24E|nr:GIY-YIG nuclease family protein [Methanobrevibacter boviskoreani]MCI6774740.1 GIY-YIG nuclease family protein [Methanobrevibacter boviskoreani]